MKRIISVGAYLLGIMLFVASTIHAQTITTPRAASPAAEVSQTIGLSKVTINYSRPSIPTMAPPP